MKKQIPFAMLEAIQPLIELVIKDGLAKQIVIDGKIACFVDADEYDTSDFHFYVSKADHNNRYKIDYKPLNAENNIASTANVEISNVVNLLKPWLEILKKYKNLQSAFDNPDRQREKQFYQETKLHENDAEYASFSYEKLLILDNYFEEISTNLIELLPNISENKKEVTASLITDISELKEEMPSISKNEVIKRLSKIFTKASKAGMTILKAIYGKFKEKIIDKIGDTSVDLLADKANDVLDAVTNAM